MKQISVFAEKIRDFVNKNNLYARHFRSNPDEWNALCATMDTLEDTCLALEYYEFYGLGDEIGGIYLKLYGLLQAVVLQQDSIRLLYRTFLGNDFQPDSDSDWMKIRDLCNLTFGYPVERGKPKGQCCFISRFDLHSNKIRLWVWNKDKGLEEFEYVDLKNLYELYKSEATRHLNKIHQALVEKYGAL